MLCSLQSGGFVKQPLNPLSETQSSVISEATPSFPLLRFQPSEFTLNWSGNPVGSTCKLLPESDSFSLPPELPFCPTLPQSLTWVSDGASLRLLPGEVDAAGPGTTLG